jgi:hypothetical protein
LSRALGCGSSFCVDFPYKNAFDPDKPILVQLCALFVSGLG